ncbi:MAG: YdcF family protein [Actinobacteria bacterium]|nr:YdcF family protein [Actinomycetota bacterium]
MQAVDIYNERYSDKIVLVNSYRKMLPGSAQLNKMAAIDLGVPEENILILEGSAKSTQDEALIIREYIRNNRVIESIILVTSKYHSGRSKKIFRKVLSGLDREISIYSSPSKYDTFNASQWWRDREDIKWVVLEYLKLANFYFRDQFLLD